VFKNTLTRRAVEASGLTDLLPLLSGPTAIAFVEGDAVIAAKALRDFGKANPALVIKGGLLGPRILTPAEIEALAEVEPREVLLARLAGGFQAPMVKAAGLFQAFTRNFAYGLKAYVDQRVAGGEALAEPEPAVATEPEAVAEPTEAAADTTEAASATAADTTEAASATAADTTGAAAAADTTDDAAPEAAADTTEAPEESN
jgi:large subunit ribosomal protein L10